ncbi:MAG: hypothetical protein OXI87_01820 [Albidovulum sp.]|nr:hypothetical protein [Albidovulum sp.]MDE0303611.1 hypothetical protein [Albidovulum sp.]MDE0533113.1 hypothetical protein [Albidovulum sp.]
MESGKEKLSSFSQCEIYQRIPNAFGKFGIGNIEELYGKLCELSHSAAASVRCAFSSKDDGKTIFVSKCNDLVQLNRILNAYQSSLDQLMEVAFNPVVIAPRVLHKFGLISHIKGLRTVNSSNLRLRSKIEKEIRIAR